jgi:arylsulfatase
VPLLSAARRGLAAGAVAAVLLLAAACPSVRRPRLILLVTVDTLRADRVGAYGSALGITPTIDRLAAGGLVFTEAFAPMSVTRPSIAALMTSRYPVELGVVSNAQPLASGRATLAERLAAHGWATGAVVSNWVLRRKSGLARGFQVFDDAFTRRELNRSRYLERAAPETTAAALRAVDAMREAPRLLLWVHYQDPHGPYTPPRATRARFLEAERALPQGRRRLEPGLIPAYQRLGDGTEVAFYRAGYDGEVAHVDEELGRLLAGLAERERLDDAVVIIAADHGESLGEHEYWFAHGELITEPLVRVPLIVSGRGLEARRRGDTASLLDVLPTVLGLASVPVPPGVRGRDLLAPDAAARPSTVYLEARGAGPGVRRGLVRAPFAYVALEAGGVPRERLFRLGAEQDDVAALETRTLGWMQQELRTVQAALSVPTVTVSISDAEREELRAMGYLGGT